MSKSKTPDADQLKKEWAELARKIEEITGERPSGQEPQKPVCANCKWKDNNGMKHAPYYWLCTHSEIGVAEKTYIPLTGKTEIQHFYCSAVNKGDCSGFEPAPPKRTWGEWLAGILFPDTHHV